MKYLITISLIFIYTTSFSQVYFQKSETAEKVSMYKEEKVIDLNKSPFNIFENKTEIEKRLKEKNLDNLYKIELPIPVDVGKFKGDLKRNKSIKHIFGDIEITELKYIPNDTYYTTQWAFNNTGQAGGTFGFDMDMELAWELETGDTNVIVGIINTLI